MTEIKRIKASELTPDIRNANRGTERGRYALEASLRDLGAGRSILVDKHGRIIGGNKTLETAAEIGLDDVLVVQTDGTQIVAVQRMDLDLAQDDKARMLAYADNRVGQLDLDFDPEVIAEDLAAGLSLDLFWQEFELDEILETLQPEPTPGEDTEPQIDKAEELRQKWGVETGQLWQLGEHRLICGDCTDADIVARLIQNEKPALMMADPEYNANMTWLDSDLLSDIDHWLIMAGDRQHAAAMHVHRDRFNQFLIVFFRQFSWNLNVYIPILQHVCVAHFRTQNAKNHHLNGLHSVIECSSKFDRQSEHPHAKHVEIVEPLLNGFSGADDLVLDFFSGSGTTIIACENLGRRCRAVEISPGYVAVALERWHQHTGKTPVLIETDSRNS